MKILIDMNLSPDWVAAFASENIESIHWISVGDPRACDTEIMEYAYLTHAKGPSVSQVRAQDILPSNLAATVISVIRENQSALEKGALMVIDQERARVRLLPLKKNG